MVTDQFLDAHQQSGRFHSWHRLPMLHIIQLWTRTHAHKSALGRANSCYSSLRNFPQDKIFYNKVSA
jgi:hypothetical protein